MVHVELAAALGGADAEPVGGLVGDAAKAWLFDEGFEQDRAVAVLKLPVVGDAVCRSSQNGRGQIPALDPRQDQEAGIVDHQVEPLLALRGRPADEAVARLGFPGGGAEAEQREEVAAGLDEVTQLGAGQRLIAEVVVTVEVLVVQMGCVAMGDEVKLQLAQLAG